MINSLNKKHYSFIVVLALAFLFMLPSKAFAFYDDVPAPQPETASAVKFIDGQSNYFGGIALDSQSKVWSWGWNGTQGTQEPGMLGIEDEKGNAAVKHYAGGMMRIPYFLENNINVVKIEAGYHSNFAIDDQGKVYAWGLGSSGQIGDNERNTRNPRPISVSDIPGSILNGKKIVDISVSSEAATTVIALDDEGRIYGWGKNLKDLFPEYKGTQENSPVELTTIKETAGNVVKISIGRAHAMALNDQGEVFVWGDNTNGQHGNGKSNKTDISLVSLFSEEGEKVKDISAKGELCTVLTEDDKIYQFGEMIGMSGSNTPIQIEYDMTNVGYTPIPKRITSGKYVSYFIDQNGHLWSWGNNTFYGFFLDGPLSTKRPMKPTTAKIQPDTMGDGDTEVNDGDIQYKTPIFSTEKKPTTTLNRFESLGKWSNIDSLHPSIYDKKYMKTTGDITGKDLDDHSKVFPLDHQDRSLVYTVQRINGMFTSNFLVATDEYTGNWYLDISNKEGNPLPTGLTSEVSYPEVKESEKSWIGLSVDLDTFDYTANHMKKVPYMTSIHTFQSGSILIDSAGNLYKSSFDGSGTIAWGWDINPAYDKGYLPVNPQDGMYDLYNYELTFMRGAPRLIPGAIKINSTMKKNYLSDKKTEQIDMKIDIGTAYTDPQLNLTVEPELKQVKLVKMPYDPSSSDFGINEPTYDEFMAAYNDAESRGYETSDIAKNNNWEGITHHVGEPPIDTLVDKSTEVNDNSVVWIMLQTFTYASDVTTIKKVVFDNFYTDYSLKTKGTLLGDEATEIYELREDNVTKVTEDDYPDTFGFPLDKNNQVISDPSFGFDQVSVKRISDDVLDKLAIKPKFSQRYSWPKEQAEEKVYTLKNEDNVKNSPSDLAEKTGDIIYNESKEFTHQFYYNENPDIYFNLHYVAVDKDGNKLSDDEFNLPTETLVMKENELDRTAPSLKINDELVPFKYFINYEKPLDTIGVSDFEKLAANKSVKFTVPYDPAIKDVTLYYLYDQDERDVTLNIRQIVASGSKIEIPKTGYTSYQKANDKWETQTGTTNLRVPSGEQDTSVSYKTVKTKVTRDSKRFILNYTLPQYYKYVGYKESNEMNDNDSAKMISEKEIKVDYSDDSEAKWLTIYLEPTTDSSINYSWKTITNQFGKMVVPQSKTVKVKFFSKWAEENIPAKNLDLETAENGAFSKEYANIKDYYYKMDMPDSSGIRKFSLGELLPDLNIKEEIPIESLPEKIPIKLFFTNSSGEEEESFIYDDVNGISSKAVGIMEFEVTKDHVDIDDETKEITVWYRYRYSAIGPS